MATLNRAIRPLLLGWLSLHTEHKHKNDMQWYTHSNTAIVIDGKISLSLYSTRLA